MLLCLAATLQRSKSGSSSVYLKTMNAMSLQRVFKLEFKYLNEMFAAKVFHADYADGYMLYKVNIKAGKYWFLKHQENWRVFGDFKLSKKLEDTIISNIEKISQPATN